MPSTEFFIPGVPPRGSALAFQFMPPAHGLCVSIISNVQPPSLFTALLNQRIEYSTAWITFPSGDKSVINSRSLLIEGKLLTPMTGPIDLNQETANEGHMITKLSGFNA